jgi:Uma2 family endonuclease
LPSLQHYVLVKRDWAQVEILNRADEHSWINVEPIEGLDAVVPLPALGIDLPLSEIYRDVMA